jgi:hypothetical protein
MSRNRESDYGMHFRKGKLPNLCSLNDIGLALGAQVFGHVLSLHRFAMPESHFNSSTSFSLALLISSIFLISSSVSF